MVSNLSAVNGHLHGCGVSGTITLGGGGTAVLENCYTVSETAPTLNMGGTGQNLIVQGYKGDFTLANKTGTDITHIAMVAGSVTIDSTVSAGTIVITGVCEVTDNSTGTASVDISGIVSPDSVWRYER